MIYTCIFPSIVNFTVNVPLQTGKRTPGWEPLL